MTRFNPQSIKVTETDDIDENGNTLFQFEMDDETMQHLSTMAKERGMDLESFIICAIKDGIFHEMKILQYKVSDVYEPALDIASVPHELTNPTIMMAEWIAELAQREDESIAISEDIIQSTLPYDTIKDSTTFKDYFVSLYLSLKKILPDTIALRIAHLHLYSKGVYLPRLAQTQLTSNSDISSHEIGEIFDEHAVHINLKAIS